MLKKLLFSLSFIPLFVSAQTIQGSFKILNNKHPENEAFYIASIEKASMETYRLATEEVILTFENGFECELLSAKQLFLNGKSVNPNEYKSSLPMFYPLPVFEILKDGHLMAVYSKPTKK
jgi:hypothetical protein